MFRFLIPFAIIFIKIFCNVLNIYLLDFGLSWCIAASLQTSYGQYIECMISSTCFLGQGQSYCGWCSTFWGGCICGRPVRTARGGWGHRSEDCRDEGTQEGASPSRSQTPVSLFSHMVLLPACISLEQKKKGVSWGLQHYQSIWTTVHSHILFI